MGAGQRARPALGPIILQFTRRQGSTRIDLLVAREDAAALSALAGCAVGVAVGLVAAGLAGVGLDAGPWAALSAMAVATLAGAYAAVRFLWKRGARRAFAVTEALLQTVATAADRELADTRNDVTNL